MSDPLRTDDSRPLDAASGVEEVERDAKIEQLLLAGLDHYFAARYDQAINVWTRALFFDRNHARARAYIDRARSAQAERLRRSEELLQDGTAALHRGETHEARRLLQAAIDTGAPLDEATPLLERANRLEATAAEPPAASLRRGRRQADAPADGATSPRVWASRVAIGGVALVVIALGGYRLATRDHLVAWPWAALPDEPSAAPAPSITAVPALTVPRRGEMALTRARSLAASGALRDALSVLDRIRPTDPQKPEGDRLRADIQRQLLRLGASTWPAAASRGDRVP